MDKLSSGHVQLKFHEKDDEKMGKKNKMGERYVLTPKGIAWSAMYEAGIKFTEEQFDKFWKIFNDEMIRFGYVDE